MAVRQRRYSKEEIARRGQELYESGIRIGHRAVYHFGARSLKKL
jgi:hypothetical protein